VTETVGAYERVRDSRIAWLGKLPEHWGLLPGRACYRRRNVPNVGMKETQVLSLSFGRIVIRPQDRLRGLVPASFETYQVIEPGDIVVRPTDLQNDWNSLRFGLSGDRGIITSAYLCLRTTETFTREYGYLLLLAYDLKKVFYGLGSGLRQNLDWADFKYLPCPIPPIEEQLAIVRFLDHADRRMRRAMRTKQMLIALLSEQKQAVINDAVTRGLEPGLRFKPSSVGQLGEIPEHWDVRPFTRSVVERADYRGATPAKTESGVFLITAKNIRKGWIDYRASAEFVAETDYHTIMRRGLPKLGDLLLTTEAPLGHAALVDREDVALAQRVIRFRMDPRLFESEFVLHSVLAPYFQDQLHCRGTGSTAVGIKASKLPQLQILCPPLPEQRAILAAIATECSPLERNVVRVEREIDLLREYRIRLIADLVTGKLDVREAAAHLPHEVHEPDSLEDPNGEASEELEADELEALQA
jgi:type I restriction enzyme, S subunit